MKKLLLFMALMLLCGCVKNDITEYKTEGEAREEKVKTSFKNPEKVYIDAEKSTDENIKAIMKDMTEEEKIGQLFIVVPECVDTDGGACTYFTNTISENINKYNIGGIIFFSQNIVSPEQIKELTASMNESAKYNMFMCVDEEGGDVSRIAKNEKMGVEKFPPMADIKDSETAYRVGETIGNYMSELGFNVDFAPVCDVLTNKDNKEIGNRAFSDNAETVSLMSGEVIKGLERNNICSAVKHFPGHGDSSENSHNGYSQTLRSYEQMTECEFLPFKNAVNLGVDFVLVSHISAPKLTGGDEPCSLSEKTYDILRNEIGFQKIAVTDALNMGAVTEFYDNSEECVKALKSGADILLMPESLDEAVTAVRTALENGELSEERINESVERILRVKIERGIISAE